VTESFVYEFTQATDPAKRVIAVWKPSGEPAMTTVKVAPGHVVRAEKMPLDETPPERVEVQLDKEGLLEVSAGQSPLLIWLQAQP
jgi:hypothetical protein